MNTELDPSVVENEIINFIKEHQEALQIDHPISSEVCPGDIGVASQFLLKVMGRIGHKLSVRIPNNRYIFHDKNRKQLSIREAAIKFIKVSVK